MTRTHHVHSLPFWKETDTDKKGKPFWEVTGKRCRVEARGRVSVFPLTSDLRPEGSEGAGGGNSHCENRWENMWLLRGASRWPI